MKKPAEAAVEAKKEAVMVQTEERESSKPAPEKPKKTSGHAANRSTGQPTKTCKFAGCSTVLGAANSSGYCLHHFQQGSVAGRPAEKKNGKNGHHKNGSGSAGNGNGVALKPATVLEDAPMVARLNHFFLSLPASDKAQLAGAYLAGKI